MALRQRLAALLRMRPPSSSAWTAAGYRVVATDVGSNVNYDYYCGCDAGFALDRSASDPAPEECCCGNQMLVGSDAGARIRAHLDRRFTYRVDLRREAMPWGEPAEVALAIPEKRAG